MVGLGQRIGNYRVKRKLGQGGMGAVFEVVQEEIGRRAAIKILLQDFGKDKQSIQRFFNEARAVNIIHHPGLVGIFESGRLEDGSAFIVMEYLDGELLGARMKRLGAFSQPMALNLGRQIASALAAAHQKGIVHRDLKPDNIMVVADPETVEGERVKVFDFGLAKLRLNSLNASGENPGVFRTQSGVVLGTPTHMSPEQCRGASEIDGKADVYSLGVIMFEMLIGHPPFIAESIGELISMHLRDKPPSLRKLDKTIPAQASELIQAMLSKEPAHRPDMAEVVDLLEAMGAHRTRRAAPVAPQASAKTPNVNKLEFAKTQAAPDPQATSQATGQTINPVGGRHYVLAVGLAGVLVAASAAVLFLDLWPSGDSKSATKQSVTWMIDSEPQGAELVRADNGELVGHTPWYRIEPPTENTLRLKLRLDGYRENTVLINQSQNSNQKVSLEHNSSADAPAKSTSVVAGGDNRQHLHWQISSQPSGAEVIRSSDGKMLGKTPFNYEQAGQNGVLKLFLQSPGYTRSSVILDLSEGSQQTIILQRSGAQPKATPTRAGAQKPADKTTPQYEK